MSSVYAIKPAEVSRLSANPQWIEFNSLPTWGTIRFANGGLRHIYYHSGDGRRQAMNNQHLELFHRAIVYTT